MIGHNEKGEGRGGAGFLEIVLIDSESQYIIIIEAVSIRDGFDLIFAIGENFHDAAVAVEEHDGNVIDIDKVFRCRGILIGMIGIGEGTRTAFAVNVEEDDG